VEEIQGGATEIRENLEGDPASGRKHRIYDDLRSPRTIGTAPGTGILGPETKGRNCPTSANGDRDQSGRRRKTPSTAGLSPQSLQSERPRGARRSQDVPAKIGGSSEDSDRPRF
jgi:hypothetical protein